MNEEEWLVAFGFIGFPDVEQRCCRRAPNDDGFYINAHWNFRFQNVYFELQSRGNADVRRRIHGVWKFRDRNDMIRVLRDIRLIWRPEMWPDEWLLDIIEQRNLRRIVWYVYLFFIIANTLIMQT